MEIKSKYYQEAGANKSNAITSAGITIGIIFLAIFGLFWLINAANGGITTSSHEGRCKDILQHEGYSFSSVQYAGETSDAPKHYRNSQVHLFKVTNLRVPSGARIATSNVKCEYNLDGDPNRVYDHFVSYYAAQ